jgi:hypothetical protein
MEKFVFLENKNESLSSEILRRTDTFVRDSRLMLTKDFLSIDLISKMVDVVTSYKDVLEKITPKNDDEGVQIKSALQDLIDLETTCRQRITLQ